MLFVCLGNICRSPTAEGIFRRLAEEAGLSARFTIDSAGTGAWHAGERADSRMRAAAKKRGYLLASIARQVEGPDFERFDHVIAMDRINREDLLAVCPPAHRGKIRLLRDFDEHPEDGDVPDPYYGGPAGFERVMDIVERCCRRLLAELSA